jgi:septal ring factor EnvC (AmiA/AmiB activator)
VSGQPAVAAGDINQHTDELRTIERQIENANARTASLDREREALEAELAGLSQRLVDLAGNIQSPRSPHPANRSQA